MAKSKVSKRQKSHQKYVTLFCNEMHVSKSLVYRQSDGHSVGYTHLDQIDEEILQLENELKGEKQPLNQPWLVKSWVS